MIRFLPFLIVVAATFATLAAGLAWSPWWFIPGGILAIFSLIGVRDMIQTRHSLKRIFPLAAHIRWFFEWLRPFLRGYIVESETEGRPFNIEDRALVYRRAKDVSSVEPFGSHLDFDKPPYEWLQQSILAKKVASGDFRVPSATPPVNSPTPPASSTSRR